MSLYKYVITDPPPSRYSQHQPHKSLNLPIKKLIEPFKPLNPKPFKGTLVEPLRTLDGYPSIMKSNWACRRSSLQQGLITSEVSGLEAPPRCIECSSIHLSASHCTGFLLLGCGCCGVSWTQRFSEQRIRRMSTKGRGLNNYLRGSLLYSVPL